MTIAAVFAAGFMTSVSAQDFLAEPGTPAVAFPKLDRPVANIVSPIWHDEKERDDAGEASQLVRLLGIKSGMTVADIPLANISLSGALDLTFASRVSASVGRKCQIRSTRQIR
jgi:hypothetical protein